MATPAGFELAAHSLEGCCSIQLSYGVIDLTLYGFHPKCQVLFWLTDQAIPPTATFGLLRTFNGRW